MVEAKESGVQDLPQLYTKFEAGWSDLHETPFQKQNNKSKLKKNNTFQDFYTFLLYFIQPN